MARAAGMNKVEITGLEEELHGVRVTWAERQRSALYTYKTPEAARSRFLELVTSYDEWSDSLRPRIELVRTPLTWTSAD